MKRGLYKNSKRGKIFHNLQETEFDQIVRESFSIREIIAKLEMSMAGSDADFIKLLIEERHLDTSHFLGQGANSSSHPKGHRGGTKKKPPDQVLILKNKKSNTRDAKFALLEIGRKYECEICNLGPIWNNKKLVLHLDHINGNRLDDRQENLRILCPNCHTQTDTYTGKNIRKIVV